VDTGRNPDRSDPTAWTLSADRIYGSGLRTTVTIPKDSSLPGYATLNLLLTQSLPILEKRSTRLRFDPLNVTDNQYQLRTGAGAARRSTA